MGHWCIVVDADELLIYPHCEILSLRKLCAFLDQEGYTALDTFLVDIYPGKPLHAVNYTEGSNPLLTASYIDPAPYHELKLPSSKNLLTDQDVLYKGIGRMCGGMRKRVFGIESCLSKFALVKFKRGMFLSVGTHFIEGASVAEVRGGLLHFKFLNDFHERVIEESKRGEYWRNAVEYRHYLKKLNQNPAISLHYSGSVKFIDSNQLVDLGLMKDSNKLDSFMKTVLGQKY